jgi:hypothetical protein
MSIFETSHFKYLAEHASKNLSSYSIHFESSQSKAFVCITTNQNHFLCKDGWVLMDQEHKAQSNKPNLIKNKTLAEGK